MNSSSVATVCYLIIRWDLVSPHSVAYLNSSSEQICSLFWATVRDKVCLMWWFIFIIVLETSMWIAGFPHSSVGKQSACHVGDPSSIPRLGRFTGEGIGYSLQYSWASFVVQLVKNLPAMLETWLWSLGWEDHLEKGKATHSSILAWRISWTVAHGDPKSQTRLSNFHLSFVLDARDSELGVWQEQRRFVGKLEGSIGGYDGKNQVGTMELNDQWKDH